MRRAPNAPAWESGIGTVVRVPLPRSARWQTLTAPQRVPHRQRGVVQPIHLVDARAFAQRTIALPSRARTVFRLYFRTTLVLRQVSGYFPSKPLGETHSSAGEPHPCSPLRGPTGDGRVTRPLGNVMCSGHDEVAWTRHFENQVGQHSPSDSRSAGRAYRCLGG